jgi:hypothetical protein
MGLYRAETAVYGRWCLSRRAPSGCNLTSIRFELADPVDRERQEAKVHLGKASELLFAGKYCAAGGLVQEQFTSESGLQPANAR